MKLRLQTSITVLLVALVLATVAALGTSSYYYGQRSAHELQSRILEDTSQSILAEIRRLLQVAHSQTASDRARLQQNALRPTDFARFVQSWLRPMQTFPELAFLALTLDNGETVRIGRAEDGHLYVQDWLLDPATQELNLRVFRAGDYPDGAPVFSPQVEPFTDPRDRWLRAARRAGADQQVWTETYDLLGEQGHPGIPGTACITPAHAKDGRRFAVLAAGIDVLSLCAYLKTLRVGKEGFAFVAELEQDHPSKVVAHQHADLAWKKLASGAGTGTYVPVQPGEIADPRIRALMGQVPVALRPEDRQGFRPIEFTVDGDHYVGGYQYLPGTNTPEWIVCTVMPEREIMANVWRNNQWLLGIGIATLLLAVLAGWSVARQIARPLEQLVQESHRVGQFDVQARPAVSSHVREVTDLAVALEEMKTGLRSFQKYVPVDLVRALMQAKQEARLGGQAMSLTLFFCDIAGFTAVAERLSPDELVEQLSEFLGALSAEIIATGGTVDKYIGDAIMAFWGAPLPNPQHALAACTAALRCQAVMRGLRERWQAAGKPLLHARIGVNSGEVVVGNFGSESRLNYTVIGDAVNLASRLEGLNKLYGTGIIISESTLAAAGEGERVVVRQLDRVAVKGKEQLVHIYELLGLSGEAEPAAAAVHRLYDEALTRYRQRDWQCAIERLDEALCLQPADGPSRRLLELCREYRANPPGADWNGTSRITEK